MSEPIKWVDGNGRIRWQPIVGREKRFITNNSSRVWSSGIHWDLDGPALYRSKRRALRISARYERRQQRQFKKDST